LLGDEVVKVKVSIKTLWAIRVPEIHLTPLEADLMCFGFFITIESYLYELHLGHSHHKVSPAPSADLVSSPV
jgi:hypothetical protein